MARGTTPTATFSEKMDPATTTASTFKLFMLDPDNDHTRIKDVTVTLDPDGLKATLKPPNRLAPDTMYTAVVTTESKDMAGNALNQDSVAEGDQAKAWTFRTSPAQL